MWTQALDPNLENLHWECGRPKDHNTRRNRGGSGTPNSEQGVEQQVKIGKEESCLVLPITPYSMACSSAVEHLTVNQVVAGSIPAGPVFPYGN